MKLWEKTIIMEGMYQDAVGAKAIGLLREQEKFM